MSVPSDWTDGFFFNGNTLKQMDALSLKIFFPVWSFAAPHDPGSECHYLADDCAGPFFDNITITVEKRDNGVRGFFNADDVVRVKIHQLFIQACQCNHTGPGY